MGSGGPRRGTASGVGVDGGTTSGTGTVVGALECAGTGTVVGVVIGPCPSAGASTVCIDLPAVGVAVLTTVSSRGFDARAGRGGAGEVRPTFSPPFLSDIDAAVRLRRM